MAFEEKRAWVMLVVSVLAYGVYAGVLLSRDGALQDVQYAAAMVWSIGGAIVAAILLHILISIVSPEGANEKDQRDREIARFGEYVGHSFVVIGAVAALLLALRESDYFWIANVVYLAFVLSAVLGSVARIFAYRRGFQPW
jgi:hypothetical protein